MEKAVTRPSVNILGEFRNRELERKFFTEEINESRKYLKPVILSLGLLNTLFMIPDYFLIGHTGSLNAIGAVRVVFMLIIILLFMRISHISNAYRVSACISACELYGFFTFLLVMWQYHSPNFLIQVLGIIIIILAVFFVPNRLIYMIAVSVLGSISFFSVALIKFRGELEAQILAAGVIYTILVIIFISLSSYRINYHRRVHYIIDLELEKMSSTDALTGLVNKGKLYEELRMWMNFSRRYKTPLSLILFDVDDFKYINDKYGHLKGDEVIVEVTGMIGALIRETDTLSRWGGDEFAIIMPHTSRPQAFEITDRIRKAISFREFIPGCTITCSFGVASLNGRVIDPDQFIHAADEALYKAKDSGKNVVMY